VVPVRCSAPGRPLGSSWKQATLPLSVGLGQTNLRGIATESADFGAARSNPTAFRSIRWGSSGEDARRVGGGRTVGSDRSGVWSPTIPPTSLSLGYSAGLASASSCAACLRLQPHPSGRAPPFASFFTSIDCFLLVLFLAPCDLASDASGARQVAAVSVVPSLRLLPRAFKVAREERWVRGCAAPLPLSASSSASGVLCFVSRSSLGDALNRLAGVLAAPR
jgi:hypothetical protein